MKKKSDDLFRCSEKPRQEKKDLAKPSVHVTPVSYGAGAGVGAVGTF